MKPFQGNFLTRRNMENYKFTASPPSVLETVDHFGTCDDNALSPNFQAAMIGGNIAQ